MIPWRRIEAQSLIKCGGTSKFLVLFFGANSNVSCANLKKKFVGEAEF
jgi:hypothetical protein